jgi:hypothetical protein
MLATGVEMMEGAGQRRDLRKKLNKAYKKNQLKGVYLVLTPARKGRELKEGQEMHN